MMESIAYQVQRALYRKIDAALVGSIEEIEGRVPTNEEFSRFGLRVIYPCGKMEFAWRGKTVLRVERSKEFFGWEITVCA